MTETQDVRLELQISKLDNIFITIFGSNLILGITAYFLVQNNFRIFSDVAPKIFQIIIISSNSFFIITSKLLNWFLLKSLAKKNYNSEESFQWFKKKSVLQLTLLSTANVINLFCYLSAADGLFLIIYFLIIGLIFAARPTTKKFSTYQSSFRAR